MSNECPAGQRLRVTGKKGQDDGIGYRVYAGAPCQDCPQRSRCTSSQTGGRTIKRYEQESLKDELREKMKQSSAQREYQKRKHMVEPVFARIKQHLGLRRFSRRGLANVRMEFALYAAAHNLGRWLALSQPDLTPVFRLLRAIFCRKTPLTGPLAACAGF